MPFLRTGVFVIDARRLSTSMPTLYVRAPHGNQPVVSGPLSVASRPPMIIVANTTTPTRNCICRSFMEA